VQLQDKGNACQETREKSGITGARTTRDDNVVSYVSVGIHFVRCSTITVEFFEDSSKCRKILRGARGTLRWPILKEVARIGLLSADLSQSRYWIIHILKKKEG